MVGRVKDVWAPRDTRSYEASAQPWYIPLPPLCLSEVRLDLCHQLLCDVVVQLVSVGPLYPMHILMRKFSSRRRRFFWFRSTETRSRDNMVMDLFGVRGNTKLVTEGAWSLRGVRSGRTPGSRQRLEQCGRALVVDETIRLWVSVLGP